MSINPTLSMSLTVRRPLSQEEEVNLGNYLTESVLPYIDELIVTRVTTEDPSYHILDYQMEDWTGDYSSHEVTPSSHPHLFIDDKADSYRTGQPLNGEQFLGPFSNRKIVGNWAEVRNTGFARCTSEWRLVSHEDERLARLEKVREILHTLEVNRANIAHGILHLPEGTVIVPRLAKNESAIRWEGIAFEIIDGATKFAILEDLLTATSLCSAAYPPPDNAFKALYAKLRDPSSLIEIPLWSLIHLAETCNSVGLGELADSAIGHCLDNSLWPEERAWAASVMGDIEMNLRGNYPKASEWFTRSLKERPGWKAAMKLSRCRFHQGLWSECTSSYEEGLSLEKVIHLMDQSMESIPASLILATEGYHQLNRSQEAREGCEILKKLFPNSEKVASLCDLIK
jgi:tetratricopeptide (TPR) repeat protein